MDEVGTMTWPALRQVHSISTLQRTAQVSSQMVSPTLYSNRAQKANTASRWHSQVGRNVVHHYASNPVESSQEGAEALNNQMGGGADTRRQNVSIQR
jgi:hypothetical protein